MKNTLASCSDSDGNEHPISTKFRGSSKASRRPLSDLTNQMPLISLRKTQPTKTANGSTITITCSSDQILKTRHTSYSNLSTLEHQESVELHMPRLVRDVVDMTSVNNKASALSSSLFDLSPTQPSIPELVMLATDNTTSRATKTFSLSIGNKNVSTEPSFNSGKRRSVFDDETLNSDIVSEEYNSPCEQLLETSNMFEIGTTINTSKAITVPYKKPSILDSVRRNRKIFSSSTKKRRTSSAAAPIPRRSNRKRPSSTCDVLPIDEEGSHLYENGFEELTGWLIDLLRKGVLVLMTDVKTQYAVILHRRNELVSDAVLRVDSIRSRLTTRFGNKLFFTKLNKRSGTYVAINDLSLYTKVALSSSLHYYNNNSIKIYETQADEKEKHKQCELIFDSIKLLRRSINENLHYFKHLRKSRSTLADFNSTMFWELLEKEIFGKSDNWLKIASVSYDIINCKNERLITPKHYLLANEIFRHERSAQLLSITNRLGHTCGYKTILRLQHEAAEKSKAAFSSLSIINRQRNQQYRHDFAVIVADNFDMNKETVHGENSLHILNQIIVQTPENDEILFIVTELLTEITDQISQTVQLLAQSLASEAVSPVISQLPTIHSNYDPFIDTSLDMKLLGYSISKYFEQQMKTSDPSSPTNLPLLSGFFASFLHFDKRPVHSITFCTPINDNPSLISAAESCLRSTKAELLDKNYQKEAIIVVDEKIYKNCTKVRRETMFEYHHITIYPGDFHLMKTTMIVIWDVLDGSGIALDQSIECSINKLGKGHGGISGKFHESTIDNWINSFSYRALLTSVLHEICGLETTNNNLNSHLECTPTRQAIDETDLAILLKVLKSEHLFSPSSSHARKLLSGKIIHEDIILNICTSFDRGQEALSTYIKERLIDKTVRFEEPLKAMLRLKLRDTDFYIPGDPTSVKKRAKNDNTKDLTKTIKYVDEEMRRVIIIAEQRGLSLPSLFAHEFTRAPLALCDNQNCDLMNQQKKSAAIDYLKQQFPSSFSSSCPTLKGKSALVIDGGSLLEIRPKTRNMTVRQYAEQLLTTVINRQFQQYDRIDVVFDSSESKLVKAFTRRHGNDLDTSSYDLQIDDRLEASYHKFLHKNRAIVAARVRDCWAKPALVELLPEGKLLVAAGPDEYAIKLKKNSSSEQDWLLQSDHVEADTRLLLHTNVIMIDEYKSVVIAATDTDVILLSIAHALTIQLENVIIKSFNSTTKTDTFINSMEIAKKLKHFSIDPIILIVLHALSGSDSTSFIKNITKVKFFRTFFNNWQRFTHLSDFLKTPLSKEAIIDAEKLLLTTYSTTTNAITLDHLRATMAVQSFKEKRKSIVLNLPPTSNSFTLHCLRAARQIKIWGNALEPYLHIQSPNELDGFETVDDQLKIKWISNSEHPADKKLVTCGKCTTGCKNSRCKCGSQNINCTIYCKCPSECCKNQSNHRMSQLSLYATLSQEESDVDDFADREESNLSEEEGQLHSSCNSVNFENDDHIRTQSHNLDMSVQADNDIDGTSFATEHVEHNYCSTSTEEEQEEEHQKWSRIPSKPTIPMSPISNCRSTIASPSQRVLRPRINATEASPNYSNFKLPISPANRSKSTTSTPVTRQCRQSIKSTKRTVSIVNDENALPQNPTSKLDTVEKNIIRNRSYRKYDIFQDDDEQF
ncbi:unnamed protein product [Didymodactylos carnosus]|uniref:Tesmin/TSO1-like CXC domain-containing protein n=1 Tax=Didymodactylos carnosus TaxID=1234261 RepID=A0A815C575_9BILA|nr:unnamed protein product [Didymodactylos carnosus]CAF4075738.1 unnamed protein product [Didymodactylos carnosus]